MSLPISEEPLDVIRANECHDLSLTSGRFRRVFQELDDAQVREKQVADALATLRESIGINGAQALAHIDATIALAAWQAIQETT